jgi:uncharacterized protein (PEP-CTERM system associated)
VELFGRKGHMKLSYAFQLRDYDNEVSLPGPGTREDDRHTLKLSTNVELDDNVKAGVELRRVVRDSNLNTSDYEENVGSLFVRYGF